MYQVIIPNSIKKGLKKLDKKATKQVLHELELLALNPFSGRPLSGDLSHLMKLNMRHQAVEYRIVYRIVKAQLEIHVVHIGTRENFYNELRRKL